VSARVRRINDVSSDSTRVDYQLNFENYSWKSMRDELAELENKSLTEQFRSYQDICIETEETLRIRKMYPL
jgi:hypothetical protein